MHLNSVHEETDSHFFLKEKKPFCNQLVPFATHRTLLQPGPWLGKVPFATGVLFQMQNVVFEHENSLHHP